MRRCGFGESGLVIPNERNKTLRSARKGLSHKGFAGKAAARTLRAQAVAIATVAGRAPHILRLVTLKRAPRRINQRLPSYTPLGYTYE